MLASSAVYAPLLIIGIVLDVVMIVLTIRIAGQKGRSQVGWGILAVFFTIIALLLVVVLPPVRRG